MKSKAKYNCEKKSVEEEQTEKEKAPNDSRRIEKGLKCPNCGCRDLPVMYTRPDAFGRIRRERQCRNCARRVTSYERIN
jgi:hypothetical protein